MADEKTLEAMLAPPPLDQVAQAAPPVLETIVLRFLARVVHADGTIAPEEVSLLVNVALQMGMDGTQAQHILDDELARKSDPAGLAAQLVDPTQRREVYAMGCLMGATDGSVADAERTVLADFARGAGMTAEDAQEILEAIATASKKKSA